MLHAAQHFRASRLTTAVILILAAAAIVALACTSSSDEPAADSSDDASTAAVANTVTTAPQATESSAALANAPTPEGTRETELATAFAEWGSTCLNNNYPPTAPQLDDVDVADYQTDEQGVKFQTIVEGYGEQPEGDWEVEVTYTGWLDDGCIFDSSYTRSEPTRFPVNGVIQGWQGSLTQMKEGERRRVEIPPDLAYGAEGSPPVIPENATLTFDIILVAATNPNLAIMQATETAETLLAEATAQADETDPEFAPNTVDVTTDADGFFALLPAGEVTCMSAFAGGRDELDQLFMLQSPVANPNLVDNLDECLSDVTTRNILIGRIVLLGGPFADETVQCMEDMLTAPTLRPLFGMFQTAGDTEQWVTTHFCMNPSERVAFDRALYAETPDQEPGEQGQTFVDVQECMVDRLGASKFFANVERPDPNDPQAVSDFYVSFSEFLVADIACRSLEEGFTSVDGITLHLDSTQCIIDALGPEDFGRAMLGRDWSPTSDERTSHAEAFTGCGIETDFLDLPDNIGHLASDDASCLANELSNSEDPAASSLTAFAQLGARKQVIAGDLVALLFGTQACGIEVEGLPEDVEIDAATATCIVGKIEDATFQISREEILTEFSRALSESADCVS